MQYIIKSERHKLKQNIKKSMELIADEFQDYDLYKENYDFLNHLPIVRDLKRQIKRLQDENMALRNYNEVGHKKTKTSRKTLYKTSVDDMDECLAVHDNDITSFVQDNDIAVSFVQDTVLIKIEPDVILVEKVKPDNIVYELIDENTDDDVEPDTVDVVLVLEDDAEVEVAGEEELVLEEEEEEDEEVVLEEELVLEELVLEEEVEVEEEELVLEEEEEEVLEEEEEEVLEEELVLEEEDEVVLEEEVEEEVLEEEAEVYEITIKNKKYYTTNETNGVIYISDKNGDVGDEVGQFKNGKATFTK